MPHWKRKSNWPVTLVVVFWHASSSFGNLARASSIIQLLWWNRVPPKQVQTINHQPPWSSGIAFDATSKNKYNWPMANVDSFSVVVAFLMPQFGQSACSIGVSVSMVAAFFNVIHQHCCWPCTLLHCCHVQAALWFGFCHSISPQNNQQHWFQQCFSHCCTLQCFSGEFHWSVDLVPSTSVALQEWYHPEDPKFLHYCIPPKMKNNQSCRALVTRKII